MNRSEAGEGKLRRDVWHSNDLSRKEARLQAFALLRSCSQHTNVRLRELAGRILTELPTAGGQVPTAPLRVELNRILAGHPPLPQGLSGCEPSRV